jgi:PAS domain-containing protein
VTPFHPSRAEGASSSKDDHALRFEWDRLGGIVEAVPAQKHLVLILAREFASNLATPMGITDEQGRLVYFNEAAESIIGSTFAEAGEMPFEEWSAKAAPRTREGELLPPERRPAAIALNERRAAHERLKVTGLDGVEREIAVTAFPLFARADEFVGMVAIFWGSQT